MTTTTTTTTDQSALDWWFYGPQSDTFFGHLARNTTWFAAGAVVGPIVWEKAVKPAIHKLTDPDGEKRISKAQEEIRTLRSENTPIRALPRSTGEMM